MCRAYSNLTKPFVSRRSTNTRPIKFINLMQLNSSLKWIINFDHGCGKVSLVPLANKRFPRCRDCSTIRKIQSLFVCLIEILIYLLIYLFYLISRLHTFTVVSLIQSSDSDFRAIFLHSGVDLLQFSLCSDEYWH